MGYEIVFSYKEEVEKGVYGDDVRTRKIKLGSSGIIWGWRLRLGRFLLSLLVGIFW